MNSDSPSLIAGLEVPILVQFINVPLTDEMRMAKRPRKFVTGSGKYRRFSEGFIDASFNCQESLAQAINFMETCTLIVRRLNIGPALVES